MKKKKTVLLVDDEHDFLDITAKRLTRRGYHVLTADNCLRATEELDREPVDVVVLDVMMPECDGVDFLKEIKESHPRIGVVLLTGHASIEAGLRSLESGASDYLLKPVSLEDLIEKIEILYRDLAEGE
ncbi:MAG: response regulator [Thermoleophilia bacterium]|nr:response regulator [Thermoleophilia bacterium]